MNANANFEPCASNEMGHEYAEKVCLICGTIFCFSCCGGTNVHQGGKYDPDYMLCPQCGYDYYTEKEEQ